MRDLTRCVIHPTVPTEGFDSLAVPVARASTILFDTVQSYAARSQRGLDGYSYGLHGTPTTKVLEAQLNALDGGVATVLLPSGQAAITNIFQTLLRPGNSVLIPDTAYPPVRGFCEGFLSDFGIETRIYDPMIGAGIAALMDDTTRLVWTESPGSTTMEVQDLPAITRAAHAKGALVGCDNTWATPLLMKPLALGVDFSVQALSKWAGGHSDLLLGSITVADPDLRRRLRDTMRMQGIGVSPDDAALVLRGLETLGVRLAQSGRVGLDLARSIAKHTGLRVLHPALPGAVGHEVWKRDFTGASGLFGVVLPTEVEPRIDVALDRLRTFRIGSSFGGTRSLVAPMKVAREVPERVMQGTILRFSIGLEDPDDLAEDIARLFDALAPAAAVAS